MPQSSTATNVEWIVKTDDVRVRVTALGPKECSAWHFHKVVTDNVFCLDDEIRVELRAPDETVALGAGGRQEIPPGRVHRVVNPCAHPVRYLLVQGTGTYDFNEAT